MRDLKTGDWIKVGTAMGKVIEIDDTHVLVRTLITGSQIAVNKNKIHSKDIIRKGV